MLSSHPPTFLMQPSPPLFNSLLPSPSSEVNFGLREQQVSRYELSIVGVSKGMFIHVLHNTKQNLLNSTLWKHALLEFLTSESWPWPWGQHISLLSAPLPLRHSFTASCTGRKYTFAASNDPNTSNRSRPGKKLLQFWMTWALHYMPVKSENFNFE